MKKIILVVLIILIICLVTNLSIDIYVKLSTKNQIIKLEDVEKLKEKEIDCIIVLGAGVRNNKPTDMLADRLLRAIEVYNKNLAPKIIMSGDHGREEYDEVNIMKDFAVERGVPSEDIFMDHAGFSTYESIYRAKEIFDAKKVIIITQKYHIYRALYIANKLGIEAYGVGADQRRYMNETYRQIREILARNKDFVKCIIKPEPTFLGNKIGIIGNGNITNDKK